MSKLLINWRFVTDLKVTHFQDTKNISWGDVITDRVRAALDHCIAILVVFSPASLKALWVLLEHGPATALGKFLGFLPLPSMDLPYNVRDPKCATNLDQVRQSFNTTFSSHAAPTTPAGQAEPPTSDSAKRIFEVIAKGALHAVDIVPRIGNKKDNVPA